MSAQRPAVEELARQAQHQAAELDATIAAIAEGVTILDPSGRTLLVNPAGARMLEYSEDELRMNHLERMALVRPITDDADIRETLDHAIDATFA